MKKIFSDVLAALLRGERVVLTAVIESAGSTPRKLGSLMAVFADGHIAGSVGGGAIEFEVTRHAATLFDDETMSQTRAYSLANASESVDLGMICGGDVSIHFAVLEPDEWNQMVFERALAEPPEGGAWFAMRITSDASTRVSLEFLEGGHHATVPPEKLHRRAVFERDDENANNFDGLLTAPMDIDGTVYIFGAGHVGRELLPAATRVGFSCVVFDDRADYVQSDLLPNAAGLICGDFYRIADSVTFTERDYVVVVTRSHELDYVVLTQALPSAASYVGAMGSRRKMTIIRQRLADEAGVAAADIERLHSPIGVQIGAETPEELAVSLTAELIQIRAERRNAPEN